MGSGSGPNSGGGRRTGGGGHQRGQGDVAPSSSRTPSSARRKTKPEPLAGTRRVRGAEAAGRTAGAAGEAGGGAGAAAAGRGGGGVDNHEVVAMTASNQELVQGLLARGPTDPRGAHPSTIPPGSKMPTGGSGTSGNVVVVDIRADVDPEDVERKTWQALEKKGFGVKAVAAAMAATKPAVDAEGDRAEGFNEQKRRRTNRGLDWLILNCEEDDLPPQFREEAQLQRKKRGGKKKGGGKDTAGGNNTAVSATDPFDGDDSESGDSPRTYASPASAPPRPSPPREPRAATANARSATCAPRSGRALMKRWHPLETPSRKRARATIFPSNQ